MWSHDHTCEEEEGEAEERARRSLGSIHLVAAAGIDTIVPHTGLAKTGVGSPLAPSWPVTMETCIQYPGGSGALQGGGLGRDGDDPLSDEGERKPLSPGKVRHWDHLEEWNDYGINGRDSGIHLDEDARLDQSGSDLRSEQSLSDSRSDQYNTDLCRLSQSSPDLGIAHSEPDLRPNRSNSDLFASDQSHSDLALAQSDPDLWGNEGDNNDDDSNSTPRNHLSYHLLPEDNAIAIDSCPQLDSIESNQTQLSNSDQPLSISISENSADFFSDTDDHDPDSSQESSCFSPLALHGGHIYKARGFTDLSLSSTDDSFFPVSCQETQLMKPIDARSSDDHFGGRSISLKEWTDGIQMYANDFDLEGYLTDEGIIPESNPFHPQTLTEGQYLDISYKRDRTRPRDFWADDEDEEDEGCLESDDRIEPRFLDDEFFLEGPDMDGDVDWEQNASFSNWVPQFSHSPGLRPLTNHRLFQPGYLEAIAEDDETVTLTSDNESSCSNDKKTMEGTYSEQTTTTDKMARKNGVQREDSGIVMDTDCKDQIDVIPYTKPVNKDLNGCVEDCFNGEVLNDFHDTRGGLVNGDNKEVNGDQSYGILADEVGENMGENNVELTPVGDQNETQENEDKRPHRQVTTVILTKKEYLANGHCRTTTETTRTVRDGNGEETVTVDVKVETTEPPMPQLKEEDESESQPPSKNTATNHDDKHKVKEQSILPPSKEESQKEAILNEVSEVVSSPPLVVEVPQEGDKGNEKQEVTETQRTQEREHEQKEEQGDNTQTQPDVVAQAEKVEVQEKITKQESTVVKTSAKTENKVQETIPLQPCPQPTEQIDSPEEKEVILITESVCESKPEKAEPVEEVIVPTKSQRVAAPLPPEFEKHAHHQPTVVVTDPETEEPICQNNNNLLPYNGLLVDANVIADLVYRRFRPNVNKKKLVILLFPPPYQDLGEPVEVQEETVTAINAQPSSALPELAEENDKEKEKNDALKNVTTTDSEDEEDDKGDPQSKRRKNGFFRRVVQAMRRAFNRG